MIRKLRPNLTKDQRKKLANIAKDTRLSMRSRGYRNPKLINSYAKAKIKFGSV